ncbi:right-handed parallel beta-helix repeat-containing protein [Polyangium sp. 15x6]|uniref:right-handed parallel beta-helix repeat-containing protein n=1 Tax=Polyangium sp. 15x6 TaxID=3042687 RepID=UPI00249CE026|nr:right-handed parallel beta-helix repeat-containing protein [Polyangium sp. 15x6]MDI3287477.1 right-handed parallel beta-helix repeat-containing protein [Polyangium sp. 15x6]
MAGIPPEMCGEGFVPDGHRGCEPILPPDPCPDGMMAVPGDTVCREVAPCGNGDWGDIPVDATTEHVNAAYPLNDGDGSQAKPWKTLQAAVNAAAPGAIVAIAAGTYTGNVSIQGKAVKLWGRCPSMVEIVGTTASFTAILIKGTAASASEVRGVSITGPKSGIAITSVGVVLDAVRIHDTAELGIGAVAANSSPAEIWLTNSLVERAAVAGVLAAGATVAIERSVVRETKTDAGGKAGRGVHAQAEDANRANVTVRGSSIERNHEVGIYLAASDLLVEATAVTGTQTNGNGHFGRGIQVEDAAAGRSNATVRGSFLEENHEAGIYVSRSDALIEATVVRRTLPEGSGLFGRGVTSEGDGPEERSNLTVRASLIEENHGAGVFLIDSEGLIETTVIRETLPSGDDTLDAGINLNGGLGSGSRSKATIRGSLLENNNNIGLRVVHADALVEATTIRATELDDEGKSGWAISVATPPHEPRSKVAVVDCLIEDNHEVGVFAGGAEVSIEATVVRGTRPDANGNDGIGIAAEDRDNPPERASVRLIHSLVEKNHRTGVLVTGSDMEIDGSAVRETMPDETVESGRGIEVISVAEMEAQATLTVRRSDIQKNHSAGISVGGADALIESTVVRDTSAGGLEKQGRGINVQSIPSAAGSPSPRQRSHATVRACVIEQNQMHGVFVGGSDAVIETTVVRGNEFAGVGLESDAETGEHASVAVTASLIENNDEMGIYVGGSDVLIDASVVRDTQLREDGWFGRGIHVQPDNRNGERASAGVHASIIRSNHEVGICVINSDATIESTLVDGTLPNANGALGDGIAVFSAPDDEWGSLPPSVVITKTQLENNARAGVANFGGSIQLVSSELACHAFDLNGEDSAGYTWSFDGSHDNQCGCPEPTGPCGAKSSGLEPPTPLPQ